MLGFAGFGMYRAWELAGPKVAAARSRAAGARDRIEPAFRDATDTLQNAAKGAVEEMTEAPRDVEHAVPDAFGTTAETASPRTKSETA